MGENDHLGMSVVTAVGAAFMLSLMNMLSKLMSVVHDPVEITFWRNIVAPLSYTLIIWAVLLDWLVWDKLPAMGVVAGAFLIVGSNLFIIYREYALKKTIMPRAPLS